MTWNPQIWSLFPGSMPWDVSEVYLPGVTQTCQALVSDTARGAELLWPNMADNAMPGVMTITSDGQGNMTMMQSFRGTFTCSMDLTNYPVDVQACPIQLATPSEGVVLRAEPVRCGPDEVLPTYVLVCVICVLCYHSFSHNIAVQVAQFNVHYGHNSAQELSDVRLRSFSAASFVIYTKVNSYRCCCCCV